MTLLPLALVDARRVHSGAAVDSPDWWLERLMGRLVDQAAHAAMLDSYFRGDQPIPTGSPNVRQAVARMMRLARTNFAELVVEAVRERMIPAGFRTGAVEDPTGDAEAWRVWQANSLDADADLVHRAQLALGAGYVLVGGVDAELGVPLITPEDPRQVVAELDPVRRRRVRAALKVFGDDLAEADRAFLYLPGQVWRARRPSRSMAGSGSLGVEGWEWESDTPEALPAPVVPVVPFLNRSDLFGRAVGEFEPHLGLLDRINFTILSRLEIATLQAFRQRAVKGVPVTDAAGHDIDYSDVFAADPGALWLLPETAELWESGQVDLGPVRQAIRDDVEHLAAVSRTPMHYFAPAEANQSAEGASVSREALVFKTRDRLKQSGESWEQTMALAFRFAGDEVRAQRAGMEILWQDPERRSLAERADAASKAEAGGVPWRTRMSEIWQFTPQVIDRMEAERTGDALLVAMAAPIAPAPAPLPPAGPGPGTMMVEVPNGR